ncbi:MAG: cytochrome c biogenesis heme-transporting ATPase CcmA [Usitatibacteraceae bacterium]
MQAAGASAATSSPTTSAAHTLVVRELHLIRGTRSLITNLSFKISSGQVLILRGANGSGKTSLLRILAGLTIPDGGTVEWDSAKLKPLSASWRAAALYLGHTNALKDDFTAHENLIDALSIDGISAAPADQLAALEKVGLLERRHVLSRRLSQGQKRRVGLARLSLALGQQTRKPLWLLDEPTNALDGQGVALFSGLIRDHLASGGMACIATHLAFDLGSAMTEMNLDAHAELAQ